MSVIFLFNFQKHIDSRQRGSQKTHKTHKIQNESKNSKKFKKFMKFHVVSNRTHCLCLVVAGYSLQKGDEKCDALKNRVTPTYSKISLYRQMLFKKLKIAGKL